MDGDRMDIDDQRIYRTTNVPHHARDMQFSGTKRLDLNRRPLLLPPRLKDRLTHHVRIPDTISEQSHSPPSVARKRTHTEFAFEQPRPQPQGAIYPNANRPGCYQPMITNGPWIPIGETITSWYQQHPEDFKQIPSTEAKLQTAPLARAGRPSRDVAFVEEPTVHVFHKPYTPERYIPEPHTAEPPPVQRAVRYVGGWIATASTNTAVSIGAIIAVLWNIARELFAYQTPRQEIRIVENGNKRRMVAPNGGKSATPIMSSRPNHILQTISQDDAVASQDTTTSGSDEQMEIQTSLPGDFPAEQSQDDAAVQPQEATTSDKPEENSKLPTPPESRPTSSHSSQSIDERAQLPSRRGSEKRHRKYAPFSYKPEKTKQQRDDEVDAVIDRAKRVVIDSPDSTRSRILAAQAQAKAWAAFAQRQKDELEAEKQMVREKIAAEAKAAFEARKAELKAKMKAQEAKSTAQWEARKAVLQAKAEAEEAELAAKRQAIADRLALQKEEQRTAQLISELSPEWEAEINKQMAIQSHTRPVVMTQDNVQLTRKDFGTLLPQEGTRDLPNGWLNDEIVNGFMSTVVASKQKADGWKAGRSKVAPAYAYYPSNWYQTYKQRGINGLATWSRRKGVKGEQLLGAEKIYFPINTGAHWMLLIISPKARTIEFMDSFNVAGERKRFFGIAREWLQMELGDALYHPTEWTDLPTVSQAQANSNDCGVFTCFNALASAKGRSFGEVTAEKMPTARRLLAAILMKRELVEEFAL